MSMEEPKTWRELLGKVTSGPQERQRIAEILGVNPLTLIRWTKGQSNPRPDKLRPLLNALPQHRKQFIALLAKEYPHILHEVKLIRGIQPTIPSEFYAHVLHTHIITPTIQRTTTLSHLISQQMIEHLDPYHLGIAVTITQCVQPTPEKKVRSLRITLIKGTAPWNNIENCTLLLGAESLPGHALVAGRFTIVQSHEENQLLFPIHHYEKEESIVAHPILLADGAAGCLCVVSTQRNYFTQTHLDLIQRYADLLVLAFDEHEFYNLNSIELGVMPNYNQQHPYLSNFQNRVTQHMVTAVRNQQSISRRQAEQIAWHEIEKALLHPTQKPEDVIT